MMKKLTPLATAIVLAFAGTATASALEVSTTEFGQATMVKGDLGTVTANTTVSAVKRIIAKQSAYQAQGNEDFSIKRQWTDKLGKQHTHLNQTINGLTVYGTNLIIHSQLPSKIDSANKMNQNQAEVYAISGTLATNSENIQAAKALAPLSSKQAILQASKLGKVNGKAELAYIYLPQSGATKLAHLVDVSWNNGGADFGHDHLFYDAKTGQLLTRHAKVHSAKVWSTHDLLNQNPDPSTLPGPAICVNQQSCGDDESAQRAHDGASIVYDYYLDTFGRVGIDDNDMPSVSSVHLGVNVANAFWTGAQMIYGDGDGVYLNDLTLAPDVIGHELTHGVTQYTAGLIYANASGALNEAFSDIFGASSKAYRNNTEQPVWLLGIEALTDKFPREAFRYMDDPTLDGYSRDHWPERIPYTQTPQPGNDFGGVHGNSGIANLAYVLLTDGGKHPRGKTDIEVHQLGLAKSEQIFYRALSTYLTPSSDFAAAKAATTQAAYDLYGPIEVHAVNQAWCAVGVGGEECQVAPECDVESWQGDVAYWGGQRAKVDGLVYQAKWWTQAQDPSANDADWYVWQLAQACLSAN